MHPSMPARLPVLIVPKLVRADHRILCPILTVYQLVIAGLTTLPGWRQYTPEPRDGSSSARRVIWPVNRPIGSHFYSGGWQVFYSGEYLHEAFGEPEKAISGVAVWE